MRDYFKVLEKTLQVLDDSFAPIARSERESLVNELGCKEKQRSEILRGLHILEPRNAINCERSLSDVRTELERKLNNSTSRIADVEKQITGLSRDIELKAQALKNIQAIIDGLEHERSRLQRDIDERGIIKKLCKHFFGDCEKSRLSQVTRRLNSEFETRSEIIAERDWRLRELDECNRKRTYWLSELKREKEHLGECKAKVVQLRSVIELENEIEYLKLSIVENDRKFDALRSNKKFARDQALLDLGTFCRSIRSIQPQLCDCSEKDFVAKEKYPDAIAYGNIHLSYGDKWHWDVPRIVSFPLKSAILYESTSSGRKWIEDLVLRIFQCVPLSGLSITVVDPVNLGKSLSNFHVLLKNHSPFPAQRFLTRDDEIEDALNQHLLYVENLIQKVFISGIKDWADYNRKHTNSRLPYKLLIVYDLPEQLTEPAIKHLIRLIEHGPRCGVLPLLALDEARLDARRHASLIEVINRKCRRNEELYRRSPLSSLLCRVAFLEKPESSCTESDRDKLLTFLARAFADVNCFNGQMEDLWGTSPLWGDKATSGLCADVGWACEGNTPVSFKLGDMPPHALLGGKSGSGKSNFIHVLIHSLCHRYSPEELNLYLLDYKEGTEFNIYANPLLPHAQLVATESDVEYGVTVLKYLKDELQRRSEIFKKIGVPDYRDFRQNNSQPLPRILLVVDEFQRLFSGDRHLADEAEKHINDLLRQGRSFGIHIMLATQTIRGLQNQSVGQLISNLGCRIALSCSPEDSALILGNSNGEASTLKSPPEGILNNENGIKSANVVFNIPFAKKESRIRNQQFMLNEARRQCGIPECKIFNGNTLPKVPSKDFFVRYSGLPGLQLVLGETYDFEAKPFVVDIVGNGLLIAGHSPSIRFGLLDSIFKSIEGRISEGLPTLYISSSDMHECSIPRGVIRKSHSWDFADFEQFVNQDGEKLVIINSFDFVKKIHPVPSQLYKRPGTPESPYDILKRCADVTQETQCHIIIFVENYQRYAMSAKDLFSLFELRVGFGMNDDVAGNFVSNGSFGKFRGLEGLNKAICVNNLANTQCMIRPFAVANNDTGG